jgi:apolipoprotein D and lipocalin family protein
MIRKILAPLRKRTIGLLWAMLATQFLGACSTEPPTGIAPVHAFDLDRYQGRWYEIARIDHAFEQGLIDVTATYTPQGDGSVAVVNRGYDASSSTWKTAHGRAYFNGPSDVGSFKVSFFGPFYGGYHVVELDPAYRWAMVVGNDRSYLWILSRTPSLPDAIKKTLATQATRLGFDAGKLHWVPQTRAMP